MLNEGETPQQKGLKTPVDLVASGKTVTEPAKAIAARQGMAVSSLQLSGCPA
jgi:hypothetical protein